MSKDTTRSAQLELRFPPLCKCGCGQLVPLHKYPSLQRQYIGGHQPAAHRPIAERFWEKVDKREPGVCWEWQGSLDRKGYGQLKNPLARNNTRAHRLSWVLAHGDLPDDLCVLHKCDNRKCVNPNHLFIGTVQDNMRDMREKGRHAHGDTHPHVKLSNAQVEEVRERYARGDVLQRELAQEYGISVKHLGEILAGRKRSHP